MRVRIVVLVSVVAFLVGGVADAAAVTCLKLTATIVGTSGTSRTSALSTFGAKGGARQEGRLPPFVLVGPPAMRHAGRSADLPLTEDSQRGF